MKNQRNLLGLIVLSVGLILLFLFIRGQSNGNRTYRWYENYNSTSQQPYGAYIIYELLKDRYSRKFTRIQRPLPEVLKQNSSGNSNYVFIGKDIYLKDDDVDALTEYVSKGNNVFISVKRFPDNLLDFFQYEACDDIEMYSVDDVSRVSLSASDNEKRDSLVFNYKMRDDELEYYWEYFEIYDCDYPSEDLGYFYDDDTKQYYANFVKINYGEGSFYLHTTPLALSNYHLRDEKKLLYADQLFSHLSDGKVYWDERSKYSYPDDNQPDRNPLQYVLAQPSLRWAWYLVLLGGLIYFVFFSKRRQRVIPILPANINSSIEFAETTGRLYYQSENHFKLARHIYSLFLIDLKRFYNIHIIDINQAVIEKVAMNTGVSNELIKNIFDKHKTIEFKQHITHQELMQFHQLIESFNKQRK